jgi:lysine-specific demethylase 8
MHKPINPEVGPEPLVIRGAINHWPALDDRPWKSPSYLLEKTLGGRRLVPIEVGRSYVDEAWGQKIVPFKEFLDEFIMNASQTSRGARDAPEPVHKDEPKGIGYLAQHNLFTQISALRNDVATPDYCFTSPPVPHYTSPMAAVHAALPELDDPILNAWFGPAGTISPLHVDPYHNILAQVVGRKYVRLYAPRESGKLYPRGEELGVDMGNTSAVDVGVWEGWDEAPKVGMEVSGEDGAVDAEPHEAVGDVKGEYSEEDRALDLEAYREEFPDFGNLEFVDVILEEGDCLYIPVGWWHYVRSVSISFSVSFWWN